MRKDAEASGETSKARENLGYEVEQETGETSKELGTMEKSKTEKRRRKKLKGIYKRTFNVFFNLLKIFVRYNSSMYPSFLNTLFLPNEENYKTHLTSSYVILRHPTSCNHVIHANLSSRDKTCSLRTSYSH